MFENVLLANISSGLFPTLETNFFQLRNKELNSGKKTINITWINYFKKLFTLFVTTVLLNSLKFTFPWKILWNRLWSYRDRNTNWSCSVKKNFLKNFANFTRKHLCWSLSSIDLQAQNCKKINQELICSNKVRNKQDSSWLNFDYTYFDKNVISK